MKITSYFELLVAAFESVVSPDSVENLRRAVALDRRNERARIRLAIGKLRDRMRTQQLEALAAAYSQGRADERAAATAELLQYGSLQ
jgi:hypothetical protein